MTSMEAATSTFLAQPNVLPVSMASIAASSSACFSVNCPSLYSKSPRCAAPALDPHVELNALCAASTARSTSASVASETLVMDFPVAAKD